MTIYAGSRYENQAVVSIQKPDGDWAPTVLRIPLMRSVRGEIYSQDGDTLQHLAGKYYNDAEKWWVIADANPQIIYPDDIAPGTVLRIP